MAAAKNTAPATTIAFNQCFRKKCPAKDAIGLLLNGRGNAAALSNFAKEAPCSRGLETRST
jgi:hypothetical protein